MAKQNFSTGQGGKRGNFNRFGWLEANVHPQHGGGIAIESIEELVTIAASAYTDCSTAKFPAGSIGIGVCARMKTPMTTAVNIDIGISGATTRFATNMSDAAGTTAECPGADIYATETAIRLTPDTTPGAADGRVYIQIHFVRLKALTGAP